MAKKAKKAAKKAAPAKKAAKKAAPKKTAATAASKKAAPKKAAAKSAPPKKAAKKPAEKPAAKKSAAKAKKKAPSVRSPRAVAAARTPPKSARPPKSSKAAKAAAAAEAEAKRPVVVKPRAKGAKAAPLDGIVVLDLTSRLPGRIATQMLASFGAEVIKVEPAGRGEEAVHVLSSDIDAEDAVYAFLNRGKKSIALNLKKNAGKDVLMQLAKRADVLVESARPGAMDSMGLGYKNLKNQNKGLIYASLSGYGQTGPMAKTVGYDLNFMALAGLLDLFSGEDGNPLMPGLQLAETAAGAFPAVMGILLALQARERTGVGQQVDVSMYDGLIGVMSAQLAAYSATRRSPQRGKDKLFGKYACYNIYPVRNGRWVAVAALEPDYWKALCKAVGREDLIEDQYASGDRQQVLIAELTRIFQKKEISEWMEFLAGKDVCVTEVRNLGDTLHDEHLIAREMIVQVRTGGAAYPHVGVFPKLSETPGALGGDPPAPGQDTESILESLGLAKKKIAELLKSGAAEAASDE